MISQRRRVQGVFCTSDKLLKTNAGGTALMHQSGTATVVVLRCVCKSANLPPCVSGRKVWSVTIALGSRTDITEVVCGAQKRREPGQTTQTGSVGGGWLVAVQFLFNSVT
jgi:hypothetical protein